MASLILPAEGEDKSLLILEYKNLLNKKTRMAIRSPIIMAIEVKTLLSSITNFQPNNKANNARVANPIYPLNLSSNTVATTSRGRFVCAARSILRTRSPPIVEGKNKLKNIPPANGEIILFKGSWILMVFNNIFQRKRQRT